MKNPNEEIMKAIVTALSSQVEIDEVAVPVYSFAPVNESRYIWLTALRGREDWTKDKFGGDWYFDINCIDRVKQGAESIKNCMDIATQVMGILQPEPSGKLALGNGVDCLRLQLTDNRDLSEMTYDGTEFRVLLGYRVMLTTASTAIPVS